MCMPFGLVWLLEKYAVLTGELFFIVGSMASVMA